MFNPFRPAGSAYRCLVEARYANRSRTSRVDSGSSRPSGIIEVVDGLMASTSSRGKTTRSLAVWMTSDVGVCSRMIPDTRRPSVVATLVSSVVPAHGGARVEDVFEDVVGIGAVRAGQLGADVAAGIKELVARQAGAVEDGPATRRVRRRVLGGREHRLVLAHQGGLGFRRRLDLAPDGFEPRANPRIGEGQQLAGDRDAHIAARDATAFDGLQERQRPRRGGRPAWRSRRHARTRCSCRSGSR